MEKIKKTQLKYYHYLLFSGVLWGFTPLIYKKSLLITSIFGLLLFRYFFGAVLLFLYDHKKYVKIKKNIIAPLLLFVLIAGVIPGILYAYGVTRTSAIHASFISLALPFFVYLFSVIFLKDTIHKKVIIGSILASMGLITIILFGSNSSSSTNNFSLYGDMFLLISQMFAALGIVYSRQLLAKKHVMPPEQLAFYEYFISFLVYFVLTIILSQTISYSLDSATSIMWLILAATVAGSVPLVFYYRSVQYLPAERIPDVNFVVPFVGFLVAVTILNESINPIFLVGAVLLFVGLMFSNNKLHPLIWGAHLRVKEKSILEKVVDIEKAFVKKSKAIYYDIVP